MAYQRDVSQHPDDAEIVHLLTALTDAAPPPRVSDRCIEQLYSRLAPFYDRRIAASQSRSGDAAPRTAQTINAIENGKSDPSLPLAFAMARLFGRAIEEIFDDGVAGG